MLTRLQRYAIFPTAANLFCKEPGKRFKSPCPPVRFCRDGCDELTSVTLPHSLTRIGNEAFVVCKGLTSVTIPDNVTSIALKTLRTLKTLKTLKTLRSLLPPPH